MSTIGGQIPRPADEWHIVPVTVGEHQRLNDFLTGNFIGSREHSTYLALQTLGILAAGQAYFGHHEEASEITIVRNRPISAWSLPSKQLKVCIEDIAGELKHHSLETAIQNKGVAVIHGQLPAPAETVGIPELAHVSERLAEEAVAQRRAFRHGIGYAWMTRQKIGAALNIGYADPYTGQRFEAEFSMGLLISQHGYPPPNTSIT